MSRSTVMHGTCCCILHGWLLGAAYCRLAIGRLPIETLSKWAILALSANLLLVLGPSGLYG